MHRHMPNVSDYEYGSMAGIPPVYDFLFGASTLHETDVLLDDSCCRLDSIGLGDRQAVMMPRAWRPKSLVSQIVS